MKRKKNVASGNSYNYEHFSIKPYERLYRSFASRLKLGSLAPDFTCIDTDGKRVRLSDYRERSYVVLEFGCMTCAPAVAQSSTAPDSMSKKLLKKFGRKGVEFLMVYTRETHPGENVDRHTKFEEKLEHARRFKAEEGANLRVLVDSLDGKIHRNYGLLPNMIYIINKEGRVAYKASWTDSKEIDSVLENLLLWEKEGFTPLDSVAVVEKYHFITDRDMELRRRVYSRAGERAIEDLRKEIDFPL